MNNLRKLVIALFLFLSSLKAQDDIKKINSEIQDQSIDNINQISNQYKFEIPIRVLLEKNENQIVEWTFESDKGFFIFWPKTKKRASTNKNKLKVDIFDKKLIINNKIYPLDNIIIVPKEKFIKFNGYLYKGYFAITNINKFNYLVNHLDLENYVETVLPAEGVPDWPEEFQCAMAVCIRSYGIAKVLEHRQLLKKKKLELPYDIKNTIVHQVYRGLKPEEDSKKIVDKTKNLVLSYNNKPIIAMFDIACGSVIPSKMSSFNFKHAPYLARSYACEYCKEYKCYNWSVTYTLPQLEAKLKTIWPKLTGLKDISILKKDAAGVITSIKATDKKNRVYTTKATKLRSLLNLKSLYFKLDKNSKNITFVGKGFGHLTGLCQYGLRKMIELGYDYKNALSFFYPKTTLMKLVKKPQEP